jgi:serine-type D-Ala-D-Ala carboxypeptidase (penicillin-binding protein 5/6)
MDHTAPAQGMTGISYPDASGLDPATTSTAADQVRLGMAAMGVPARAVGAAHGGRSGGRRDPEHEQAAG